MTKFIDALPVSVTLVVAAGDTVTIIVALLLVVIGKQVDEFKGAKKYSGHGVQLKAPAYENVLTGHMLLFQAA